MIVVKLLYAIAPYEIYFSKGKKLMNNLIKVELKKCFNRKEFKIIFIVIIGAILLDFFLLCKEYYGEHLSYVMPAYNGTIITNIVKSPLEPIISILLPLTVSIIYSDSYLSEENMGIGNLIDTRVGRKTNIKSKVIAIIIISFFVVFIPLIINMILSLIAFPFNGYNTFGLPDYKRLSYVSDEIALGYMQIYYPYINLCIFIFIRSLYSVAFALLSFGISFYSKRNKYISILSAFIINMVFVMIFEIISRFFSLSKFSEIIGTSYLSVNPRGSFIFIIIILALYFCIDFILINGAIDKIELD